MNQIWLALQSCKSVADFRQAVKFASYLVWMIGGEQVRNQPDGFYGRGLAELLN